MVNDARTTVSLDELMQLKADARGFTFSQTQPAGSLLAGRHSSRIRGRGLAFEELRHYQQGDDIRLIDWKATARMRSAQVRVYTEERERPTLVLVDQRRPMFFGSRRTVKSVVAAEMAALASWKTLDSGDRVGGLVFNEDQIVEVRPHRSESRLFQLFGQVVSMNQRLADDGDEMPSAADQVSINDVLRKACQLAKHDHLVFLISDLDGADDQTRRLATELASHNDVIVIAVYDPLGIRLTGAPGMLASDRGTVWQIPEGQRFHDDFREAFQRLLDHWRDVFRSLRIPIVPICTADDVAGQVRAMFGSRGY
ncbi:hypothetical protein Mal65_27160 [Crateriforma conspicua]|nr:hypothetical protein Mal65_27160 [Crateriforma conspicua]